MTSSSLWAASCYTGLADILQIGERVQQPNTDRRDASGGKCHPSGDAQHAQWAVDIVRMPADAREERRETFDRETSQQKRDSKTCGIDGEQAGSSGDGCLGGCYRQNGRQNRTYAG